MQPKQLGDYWKSWKERIPEIIRYTFVTSFLIFLFIHLYCFTNKFMNSDDLLVSHGGAGITSGRWFKSLVCMISSTYSMPWVNGVLSGLYMAISVCAVVSLFRIRNKLSCIAISVLMAAYPTVAATLSYMYTADAYFAALALACLGALVTQRYRNGWIGGGILLSLSLGIYQAYLGMGAALLVFSLLHRAITEGDTFPQLFIKCCKGLLSLILGLILYKLTLEALLKIFSYELSSYMGISSMWELTLPDLLKRIYWAYRNFFLFYTQRITDAFPARTQIYHLIILAGLLLLLVCRLSKTKLHRNPLKCLLIFVLIALAPLACNCIYVMSSQVHVLMVYPILLPVIAVVVFLDDYLAGITVEKKNALILCLCGILVVSSTLFGYDCAIITNKAYLKMDVVFHNTLGFNVKLTERIESVEGYEVGMPVIFVGKVNEDNRPTRNTGFSELDSLTGVESELSALSPLNIRRFCRFYLGFLLPTPPDDMMTDILSKTDTDAMAIYPAEGSIVLTEGVVVVKFSE